jgi:hypothetical protein
MQIRWPLGGERVRLLLLPDLRRLFHDSQAALKLLDPLMCGIELLLDPSWVWLLRRRRQSDADETRDEKRSHAAASAALNHTLGV